MVTGGEKDLSADFTRVDNVIATSKCGGYVTVDGNLVRANPIITWRYSSSSNKVYFHILIVKNDGSVINPSTTPVTTPWNVTIIGS